MGRNVWILSSISFAVAVGFGVVAPVLPLFAEKFGANAFMAAVVITVFALMRFVFSLAVGWLVDRLGHRQVLIGGLLIVAASSAAAGLAPTYLWLVVLRGAGGIGSAMFSVSGMSLLLGSVSRDKRGRAAGLYQAGFLTGAMAGPALGGALAQISMSAPFFFYAGTLGVAALVALALVKMKLSAKVMSDAENGDTVQTIPLRVVARDRRFIIACFANLVHGWNSHGARSVLVPLLVGATLASSREQAVAWTGLSMMVASGVQTALVWPAGWLVDKIGRRGPMVAGAVISALALAAIPWAGTIVLLAVALSVYAVGAALLGSAPAALVGDASGPVKDQAVAVFSMCGDAGAIVGPLIVGALTDAISFKLAFGASALLWAVSAALSLTLPRGDASRN
ncbi:MAG: MFS transporter [Micrococcales bacterium]|nr:MFS transporter [Micrococcales bacterium]